MITFWVGKGSPITPVEANNKSVIFTKENPFYYEAGGQISDRGYDIVGDVDYHSVINKVKYITPVPGGVGPMTIAMLLHNTIQGAKNINSLNEV